MRLDRKVAMRQIRQMSQKWVSYGILPEITANQVKKNWPICRGWSSDSPGQAFQM